MFLKNSAKVVSIEDTPEINIYHSNWIQAVTRVGFGRVAGVGSASSGLESGLSGFFGILKRPGDIVLYDLLVAALRQRPDYILVGEVRGEEAYTMFQAISIGHPSLGTIHSGSLLELLARVESRPMSVPRPLLASLDCVAFTAIVSSDSESDSESRRKVRKAREVVEILDLNLKTNELRTNVVFSWDSQTDRFIFKKSFLFDSIERDFGVKTGLLREEMQRRAALLDRLCRLGITDYKEVTRAIQSYYLRPDETYEKFLKKSDEARVV